MDEYTKAAIDGITRVAIEATTETATYAAKAAWGKLKDVLGWKSDPAQAEVEALAEKTLTANPALAAQTQQIVNDYRQQVGGVSVGKIDAKTSIVGQTNTFSGPVTFG